MKNYLILLMIFLPLISIQSQIKREKFRDHQSKIEELEKIKLIETLKMDEETSLRFFARRNEHRNKVKEINEKLAGQLDEIEQKINSAKDDNDPEFRRLVDNYLSTHQQLAEERERFINSLTDILTTKQIAQLTLFERRFKEEIRDVLLKRRKWKND